MREGKEGVRRKDGEEGTGNGGIGGVNQERRVADCGQRCGGRRRRRVAYNEDGFARWRGRGWCSSRDTEAGLALTSGRACGGEEVGLKRTREEGVHSACGGAA